MEKSNVYYELVHDEALSVCLSVWEMKYTLNFTPHHVLLLYFPFRLQIISHLILTFPLFFLTFNIILRSM